jgi:peptide/nickel transport system ATP-binding protein
MIEPVLDVRDLRISYGATQPVKGISFQLTPGQRLGLVGESGSGKSLTALSIMRLSHGAKLDGQILLDGRDLLALPERAMERVRGGQIGMVYQDPMSSLNPVHTIGKQIAEALRIHEGLGKGPARARAIELLTEVGVNKPEIRVDQYPHEFSGGMRQRVMIAIAMSASPSVLICDEPTTALDVTTQARIIDLLDRLASEKGTAVLLITHDLGVAAGFCDDIIVMRHGEIIERAPAVELYSRPRERYTKALLGAVVDLTIDVTKPIPTLDTENSVKRDETATVPSPASHMVQRGFPLVVVDDATKTFRLGRNDTVTAVNGVTFEVRSGETFGLVGESGSGKSTMARAVLGLTPIDKGAVRIEGKNLSEMRARDVRRLRRDIQMVFQDPFAALNRRQTVEQILRAPLQAHRIGTRATQNARVDEVLDLVGLGREFRKRYPRSMSGGQCQRVAIARALVLDPKFIVLDESVSSLDVSIQAQVLNLLRSLQAKLGLTYLFISHDLAVVRYMAQRLAVMQNGSIVEQGTREELFSSPKNPYTRQLLDAIPVADPVIERARRSAARESKAS